MVGQAEQEEIYPMPPYLIDLLSWTVAFIVLFVVFRYLQRRKSDKDQD